MSKAARQPQFTGSFKHEDNGNLTAILPRGGELPDLEISFPESVINKHLPFDNSLRGDFSFNFLSETFTLFTSPHGASCFVTIKDLFGVQLFDIMPEVAVYQQPRALARQR